jgi:hypothetical protein
MARVSDALHSRWGSAAAHALVWLPAAALGLYLKHAFMEKQYLVIARALGRDVETDITVWEALSFYRADLLILWLLVPLGLTLVLRLLPKRYRSAVAMTVSVGFVLFFFVNLQTLGNVGRYMSIGLLFDTIRWGVGHPAFIEEYLPLTSLLKLLGVLLMVGALAFLASAGSARRPWRAVVHTRLSIAFVAVLAVVLVVVVLAWAPRLPSLAQHRSALRESLVSFFDLSRDASREFQGLSATELAAVYRAFTRAPEPTPDERFWGKAAGHDVILFVFETGPARSLDLQGDLAVFPSLRALLPRSLAAVRHHSTYPYTSDALFAIFSSQYSPSSIRLLLQSHPEAVETGLMKRLAEKGYVTRAYSPHRARFEEDQRMFRHLGIQQNFIAEHVSEISPVVLARVENDLAGMHAAASDRVRAKIRVDRTALEALKTDIIDFKKRGERFAAAFLPQIGHGPWPDLRGHGNDYPARGRTLMAMQDVWIGEILDVLRATGTLERTVIVVTSDHGIRTRREDPAFAGGTISDYSFHVPLLVYAPGAVREPITIDWLTSHVDIAPTVLDLVGVQRRRESEQGTAIWDPRLQERTTFFLARGYLGADAFHSRGSFYMLNHLSAAAHYSTRLDFPPTTLLPAGSPEHATVMRTLSVMEGLQRRWLSVPRPADRPAAGAGAPVESGVPAPGPPATAALRRPG